MQRILGADVVLKVHSWQAVLAAVKDTYTGLIDLSFELNLCQPEPGRYKVCLILMLNAMQQGLLFSAQRCYMLKPENLAGAHHTHICSCLQFVVSQTCDHSA